MMSRDGGIPRLEFAGAIYHVISSGNCGSGF